MQERQSLFEIEHTMDLILVLMGAFLLVFTFIMIILFVAFQSVPDTLIMSVFACFGAEGGFMALIKSAKIKKNNSKVFERLRARITDLKPYQYGSLALPENQADYSDCLDDVLNILDEEVSDD